MMMDSAKNNPLMPLFRHSPAGGLGKGLKEIISSTDAKVKPVVSQLQVNRLSHSFVSSLKLIPVKKYVSSKNSQSESGDNDYSYGEVEDQPLCSICLEMYSDGDEISNLACSHCFHTECVNAWFFQVCLDNKREPSYKCPECRQDHIFSCENTTESESLDDQTDGSQSIVQRDTDTQRSFVMLDAEDAVSPSRMLSPATVVRFDLDKIVPLAQCAGCSPADSCSKSQNYSPSLFVPTDNGMDSNHNSSSNSDNDMSSTNLLPIETAMPSTCNPMGLPSEASPPASSLSSSASSNSFVLQDYPSSANTPGSTSSFDNGISAMSFLQVGQSLLEDGGYDFLSDIDSTNSSNATSPLRFSECASKEATRSDMTSSTALKFDFLTSPEFPAMLITSQSSQDSAKTSSLSCEFESSSSASPLKPLEEIVHGVDTAAFAGGIDDNAMDENCYADSVVSGDGENLPCNSLSPSQLGEVTAQYLGLGGSIYSICGVPIDESTD